MCLEMRRTYIISILICDVLPVWTQWSTRAVNQPSRSFTVPGECQYYDLLLLFVEKQYVTQALKHLK